MQNADKRRLALGGGPGMQNRCEIRSAVTAIFLRRKNGPDLECLIDTADLARVKEPGRTWRARWQPDSQTFYAMCHVPGNRNGSVQMHRWILDAPPELEVDHIHHNGLDNRRSEIRLATRMENGFNRRGGRRGTPSGVRGVVWSVRRKRWIVKIQFEKQSRQIGSFTDLEQAKAVAEAAYRNLHFEPFPSSRSIASRVAAELGVTLPHVCEVNAGDAKSARIQTAIQREIEVLKEQRRRWLQGVA